jgi:hypothetical protein
MPSTLKRRIRNFFKPQKSVSESVPNSMPKSLNNIRSNRQRKKFNFFGENVNGPLPRRSYTKKEIHINPNLFTPSNSFKKNFKSTPTEPSKPSNSSKPSKPSKPSILPIKTKTRNRFKSNPTKNMSFNAVHNNNPANSINLFGNVNYNNSSSSSSKQNITIPNAKQHTTIISSNNPRNTRIPVHNQKRSRSRKRNHQVHPFMLNRNKHNLKPTAFKHSPTSFFKKPNTTRKKSNESTA